MWFLVNCLDGGNVEVFFRAFDEIDEFWEEGDVLLFVSERFFIVIVEFLRVEFVEGSPI